MSEALPGVNHVLAVASGKGGVGKTTVAVNLALALQAVGARTGLFDADIYGPNVPLMLGVHQRRASRETYVPVVRGRDAPAYIEPLTRFGLQLMSTGLLVSEEQVIDPPPDAVGQLVVQTLRDVLWDSLDYLLLDLPPSAGQPQRDLLRHIRLDGALIVTTPQDLSLLDSSRSLQQFERRGVPILGLIENMSFFVCPHCGEAHEIFQRSGAFLPAALAQVPVVARIPLTPAISQGINNAHPLVHAQPDSPQAGAFIDLARWLRQRLEN